LNGKIALAHIDRFDENLMNDFISQFCQMTQKDEKGEVLFISNFPKIQIVDLSSKFGISCI